MGSWLYRCPDCGDPVRQVLRLGKRFHRVEDADSGAPHLCLAKPPTPTVEYVVCGCRAVVARVDGTLRNHDCTAHVCAATRKAEPPAAETRPKVVALPTPIAPRQPERPKVPVLPSGAIAL